MPLLTSRGNNSDVCPPADTYELEIVACGEFEEREAFRTKPSDPLVYNIQSKITFKILDFDFDPDEDDKDWKGEEISDYFVFQKREPKDRGDDVIKDSYLHPKSNAYPLLSVLLGHAPTKDDSIELEDFVGERLKATVEPKASGWPKISNFLPARRRRSRPAEAEDTPEPARKPTPVKNDFDDDDDVEWPQAS